MSNNFPPVTVNMTISDSLQPLLDRDANALTMAAGTEFPTTVSQSMVGMFCHRTDEKRLYTLVSANPTNWTLVLDYSSEIPSGVENEGKYQPKSEILTSLATVKPTVEQVPYFRTTGEVSLLDLTDFSKSLLLSPSAADVRDNILELGSLATLSEITGDEIMNNSIGLDKLNFTPVLEGEVFKTGDIKEGYETLVSEGWIDSKSTIGNSGSTADVKGVEVMDLFLLMWSNSEVTLTPEKGANPVDDWESNKVMTLPDYKTLNETKALVKL